MKIKNFTHNQHISYDSFFFQAKKEDSETLFKLNFLPVLKTDHKNMSQN